MTFYKVENGNIKTADIWDDDLWTPHGSTPDGVEKLYSRVSWMYRCVSLIQNGVTTMPFAIFHGGEIVAQFDGVTWDTDYPDLPIPWVKRLPRMAGMVAAAGVLHGAAYFEKRGNLLGSRILDYDWLLPQSIKAKISESTGDIVQFRRTVKTRNQLVEYVDPQTVVYFQPDELLYFWRPDPGVEHGPGWNTPGRAVIQNAGVIRAMDIFLSGYFERGMVKATLLKYNDTIMPDEAARVKSWWRRVFAGVNNAHASEVVRGDFETMTIGEGIKDLRDNALSNDEKKDIAVGFGIPLSKLDSTASTDSNRDADDVQMIENAVLPEVSWIYEVINQQMLEEGFTIQALPETLRVMQSDENARAEAFSRYRDGGFSLEAAVAILGIAVPDNVELAEPKPEPPPPPVMMPPVQPDPQPEPAVRSTLDIVELMEKRDELERFKRWLKNREDGYDVADFESDVLTHAEKTAAAHKAIAGNRRNDFIPRLEVIDEIGPDDPAVKEAIRRFDRLFPERRGLLDAAVVEQ